MNAKVLLSLMAAIGTASALQAQYLTTVYVFSKPVHGTNQDGANPIAGLAPPGNVLCGTAVHAGRYGAGTVFYRGAGGAGFSAFRPLTNSPDAANPQADLNVSGTTFYGATFGGGGSGTGAVFTGQTNGKNTLIRNFAALNSDNAANAANSFMSNCQRTSSCL